jgi:hypothetical protein
MKKKVGHSPTPQVKDSALNITCPPDRVPAYLLPVLYVIAQKSYL